MFRCFYVSHYRFVFFSASKRAKISVLRHVRRHVHRRDADFPEVLGRLRPLRHRLFIRLSRSARRTRKLCYLSLHSHQDFSHVSFYKYANWYFIWFIWETINFVFKIWITYLMFCQNRIQNQTFTRLFRTAMQYKFKLFKFCCWLRILK